MSRKELADKLAVSHWAIAKYETDERVPDHDIIAKLSAVFNVTTDYLLGRTDDPTPRDGKSTISDLEELLKQDTLMFDGEPLDEEAKDGILRFLKLVKETSEKRRKDQNKKSDSD
jgi:transcriptional regulator with XRE-family HTH domain